MSTKVIISGIAILVAGAGIFVATQASDPPQSAAEPTAAPPAQATGTPANSQAGAKTASSYVDYKEGILPGLQGQRVLFFYAPWCPQCRSIEKGIKADGVPAGFTIVKVDYDSNQELRQKYGIRQQTSFIKVDAQGNASGEPFVAYQDPEFSSVVRNYLN